MIQVKHIHTIPVPQGMTAEQAWDEMKILGYLVGVAPYLDEATFEWANVDCDGEECSGIEWE